MSELNVSRYLPATENLLYKMWKELETINKLFAENMDDYAMTRCKLFKDNYTKFGYSLSFDIINRLALLERLYTPKERDIKE